MFILQLNAYFALWNMPTRTLYLRNFFPTKKQHPEHEHKSQKFFQSKLAAYVKEQRDFEARVTEKVSEKLTLASFQMTHVLLKTKRPYTEL